MFASLCLAWLQPGSHAAGLSVTQTIAVGNAPLGVAFLPNGTRAYVANRLSNSVSVIDTATNTVLTTIPLSAGPSGIVASSTRVVVNTTSGIGNPITIIDPITNTVTATIPLTVVGGSQGIAMSADGTVVWVTAGAQYVRVDLTTNTATYSNTAFMSYNEIAIDQTSGFGFATSYNAGTITKFALDSLQSATSPSAPGFGPMSVEFGPNRTKLYVSHCSQGVLVYDTTSLALTNTIVTPGCPSGMSFTTNGSHLFVARLSADKVSMIDAATNTVSEEIAVGARPTSTKITPDGTKLYVTNQNSNTVSIIDLTSILPTTTTTATTIASTSTTPASTVPTLAGSSDVTTTSTPTSLPTTGRNDGGTLALVLVAIGVGIVVTTRRRTVGRAL